MHTATIHPDPHHWAGQKLAPGRYWLEDHNAAELMHSSGGWGNVILDHRPAPEPADWRTLDDITVVRVGGFGDLLWLNAIYDAMKAVNPDLRITHACLPYFKDVLLGYADRVVSYPLAAPDPDQESAVYWLENLIEGKACRGTEHPCDRLAHHFGLEPLARYRVRLPEPWPQPAEARLAHPARWREGWILEGALLMEQGLPLPLTHPHTAWLVELERL